ncbi:MAG: MFS transporter [Frankiaceae bacterium]
MQTRPTRRRLLGDLPREVGVLSAVAFSVALGFGFVAPALPVFARQFGVGRTAAGAVLSVFALMRLTSALAGGRLVNRFGERLILATGIGIVAISSALAGLSQTYAQLLVLRGIGGVGSAMFSISASSLLIRLVRPEQRGRATGLWSGGFLLGGIAGPAFGGLVTSESIRAPFFLYAGTLAIAGSIGLYQLRDTPLADRLAPGAPPPLQLADAVRMPAYRAALGAQFADWMANGVRSALVPLFVADSLHRSPIWTGIGFLTVAGMNGAILFPAGRLADRTGRRPVLLAGCTISAVGVGLLALPATAVGYVLALGVFGLGSGLLHVAPASMLGDLVVGRSGTVVATFTMAGDAGAVTGPLIAGRLADSVSYGAAFGVTAGVLAAAGLLGIAAPETLRRAVSPARVPDR